MHGANMKTNIVVEELPAEGTLVPKHVGVGI